MGSESEEPQGVIERLESQLEELTGSCRQLRENVRSNSAQIGRHISRIQSLESFRDNAKQHHLTVPAKPPEELTKPTTEACPYCDAGAFIAHKAGCREIDSPPERCPDCLRKLGSRHSYTCPHFHHEPAPEPIAELPDCVVRLIETLRKDRHLLDESCFNLTLAQLDACAYLKLPEVTE